MNAVASATRKPLPSEDPSRFESRPLDFVAPSGRSIVYVGIQDRAKFDQIGAPVIDHGESQHGHVLIKQVGSFKSNEVTVVFQHWLKSLTCDAMIADRAEREAGKQQP